MTKICVILPAYNEEQTLRSVLTGLKKELTSIAGIKTEIVVVDDGSRDKTSQVAKQERVIILRHVLNRGLGAAINTGISWGKKTKADYLLTFDADGQHDPQDAVKIIRLLMNKRVDVIIGTRNIKEMPFDRQIITRLSSLVTWFFFGIYHPDTQSGLRGFNKKALDLLALKTQQMEVSSEFFHEIKRNKLKLYSMPIKVIYTEYSRGKGQKNSNALSILLKLVLRLFR